MTVNRNSRSLGREELINNIKGIDGLVSMLSDPIDGGVIKSNPDLKVVANYAVGYNNIDVEAATRQGVAVTNTPGVLTEATADLTWALLMAVARRIIESDQFVRQGQFKGWGPRLMLGSDVYGKTLGIIGFGRIGQAVARRARGFNMEILYNKRTRLSRDREEKLGVQYAEVDELLKRADYISINAPLNKSTYHLVGLQEFELMKNTAIVINTGRGPIIDESALVEALKEGKIAGAGLDVYEEEPEVHPGLMELDNVVLTPHTGSGTIETRDKMAVMVAEDVIAVLKGKRPANLVNPGVYKN